jgi:hypothetical protein
MNSENPNFRVWAHSDILQQVHQMSSVSFDAALSKSCRGLPNIFETSWGVADCLDSHLQFTAEALLCQLL